MVYRGRLSKACTECRAKKTRCDTAHPSCGQCRRARRLCSGYRDLGGLRVLEQTSDVVSRWSKDNVGATNRPARRKHVASRLRVYRSASAGFSPSPLQPTVPRPLSVLVATAQSIFFAQFVHITPGHSKTDYYFMKAIYATASADGMLSDIVTALGMLTFAKKSGDRSIMLTAAEKYARALCQTQAALEDAKLVRSDETVATVCLLALHESLALENVGNKVVSSIHLDGATELLRLRGQDQFRSSVGRRIFARLACQTVMSCLHIKRLVPSSLLKLMRAGRSSMNAEEQLAMELFEIAAKLCKVLVLGLDQNPATLAVTFHALVIIDNDLAGWVAALTPLYDFVRVIGTQSDLAFFGTFDVYGSHIAANLINEYRCIRLGINEQILRYAELVTAHLHGEEEEDIVAQRQRSLSCIVQLSEDICYSVYYFLDHGQVSDSPGDPDPTMYGSRAILAPLYLAANEERISPPMYLWILRQIARICKGSGISRPGLEPEKGSLAVAWTESAAYVEPKALHIVF